MIRSVVTLAAIAGIVVAPIAANAEPPQLPFPSTGSADTSQQGQAEDGPEAESGTSKEKGSNYQQDGEEGEGEANLGDSSRNRGGHTSPGGKGGDSTGKGSGFTQDDEGEGGDGAEYSNGTGGGYTQQDEGEGDGGAEYSNGTGTGGRYTQDSGESPEAGLSNQYSDLYNDEAQANNEDAGRKSQPGKHPRPYLGGN
ncbi:hypothetical protein [Nocardia mexicana]|uniref:Uncharacterized protein n=1 Tax=Nocardia mexicana TaxID=279262 RepID=A0A370GZM7_9NOCA|nr:hypothetical protein [Nocardia mexicana]RDI48942.1 hypothetical protein DFR68_10767 [Nocardia mexicana]